MGIVPRGALVIKAKQPMVDWINKHPDAGGMIVTLEDVNEESTVILIPDYAYDKQAEKYIQRLAKWIFEGELAGWYLNKETWPKRRGYKTLLQWFDIEVHSIVVDSVLEDDYGISLEEEGLDLSERDSP